MAADFVGALARDINNLLAFGLRPAVCIRSRHTLATELQTLCSSRIAEADACTRRANHVSNILIAALRELLWTEGVFSCMPWGLAGVLDPENGERNRDDLLADWKLLGEMAATRDVGSSSVLSSSYEVLQPINHEFMLDLEGNWDEILQEVEVVASFPIQ